MQARDMAYSNRKIKKSKGRRALQVLAWLGAAILYYIVFSLLFDTPAEYELRHSTDRLKSEYKTLQAEYDTLSMVVNNLVERDRNIFAIMFDSEPYDFDSEYNNKRVELHESLLAKSNREMSDMLERSLNSLDGKMRAWSVAIRSSMKSCKWLVLSEIISHLFSR